MIKGLDIQCDQSKVSPANMESFPLVQTLVFTFEASNPGYREWEALKSGIIHSEPRPTCFPFKLYTQDKRSGAYKIAIPL